MATAPWAQLLGGDPVPWLLAADEPAARWVTLTRVLDVGPDDPRGVAAHRDVVHGPWVAELVARLPDWEQPTVAGGHNSPAYAPNLLHLLADMGVGAGDVPRVESLLDRMLEHQEPSGRFAALAAWRAAGEPVWGALACDHHTITEVLLRFGRRSDERVRAGVERIAADLTGTAQGPAWLCVPHTVTGFRGPGRKGDVCLQVTLEALRAFSLVPEADRPDRLLPAARVVLRAWRERGRRIPTCSGTGAGSRP